MTDEKRRYFRINDTIGLTYESLDKSEHPDSEPESADIWAAMSDQDTKIEKLLQEVAKTSPAVADLARALNQKLERIINHRMIDHRKIESRTNKSIKVNISACGLSFASDVPAQINERLSLALELIPGQKKVELKGVVVGCEARRSGFYWRVNFYGVKPAVQEVLIQHIVQRQSAQLKRP